MHPSSQYSSPTNATSSSLTPETCPLCATHSPILTESLPPDILKLEKEVIGQGAHSFVYRGRYHSATVAVKKFKWSLSMQGNRNDVAMMKKEAKMLWSLRHPNILTPYAVTTNPPQIVTQYFPSGSLRDNLDKGTKMVEGWKRILKILKGAISAMRCFHERDPSICHRDLKSSNILISKDGQGVVCDVGISNFVSLDQPDPNDERTNGIRDYGWQPPEVILNQAYSEKSDTHSMGIVMWEILTRQIPFGYRPLEAPKAFEFLLQLKNRVVEGERPAIPKNRSEDKIWNGYVEIMQSCWHKDPKERPSFAELDFRLVQLWETLEGKKSGLIRSLSMVSVNSSNHAPSPRVVEAGRGRGYDGLLLLVCGWILVQFVIRFEAVRALVGNRSVLDAMVIGMDYGLAGCALVVLLWIVRGRFLGAARRWEGGERNHRLSTFPVVTEASSIWTPFMNRKSSNPVMNDLNENRHVEFPRPTEKTWPDVRREFLEDVEGSSRFPNVPPEDLGIRTFCERHEELPTEQEWKYFASIFENNPMARSMVSYYRYTHPIEKTDASDASSSGKVYSPPPEARDTPCMTLPELEGCGRGT